MRSIMFLFFSGCWLDLGNNKLAKLGDVIAISNLKLSITALTHSLTD